jgi:hypothetical protein
VGNGIGFAENDIDTDAEINSERYVWDTTSFSIIFSPSGRLVVHEVRIRNKNGYPDTTADNNVSNDDIFNKKEEVDAGKAMFYQDDYCNGMGNTYGDMGLGPELSRQSFIIYDKTIFERLDPSSRYIDYLKGLKRININPYIGTMIEK